MLELNVIASGGQPQHQCKRDEKFVQFSDLSTKEKMKIMQAINSVYLELRGTLVDNRGDWG